MLASPTKSENEQDSRKPRTTQNDEAKEKNTRD
jgi:hypothetical protein